MASPVWFSSGIAEAIAEAKSRNSLFIVFVCDSTEKTLEMDNLVWNDGDVASTLADSVAIRVDQSTPAFSQFSQFYPVMIIPSTYFISPDGTPLEIVAGSCGKDDFKDKLQKTISNFKKPAEQTRFEDVVCGFYDQFAI